MFHETLLNCLTLFLETFVQEDLAILSGSVMVTNETLSFAAVLISLIAGLIIGDIIIYGIGWLSRKVPWLYRKVYSGKVENAKTKIHDNLISALIFVRFVPGLLFPTYIACGFTGVSFKRFIFTTGITGTAYTVVFLAILVKLGEALIPTIGHWLWIIILATMLLFITYRFLKQRRLAAATTNNSIINFDGEIPENDYEINGMPSLRATFKRVALSERIPPMLFYSPVAIRWLLLGIKYRSLLLPTVSNPYVEAGGLWGESKSRLMDQIGINQREWIAPYTTVIISDKHDSNEMADIIKEAMKGSSLDFPIVVKPDIGWQGYGVRSVQNEDDLRKFIALYPLNSHLIIQQLLPWEGEAGVFYSRLPGDEQGKVISLTLRYYPHVIGDGVSTVRQLINNDDRSRFKNRFYHGKDPLHEGLSEQKLDTVPEKGEVCRLAFIGSIRVGGLYRDASGYITEQLSKRIDEIGKSMPEFYFGRFDIKFRSLEALMKGEDFRIFEINGAGAEAIHVWDASTPLRKMYSELFRFQSLMFEISDRNRTRGFAPMPMKEFYKLTKNYNQLISSYPPSE
jgi:membrane protein DedA with SNARE-associated domain